MKISGNISVTVKEAWGYFSAAISGKTNLLTRIRAILSKPREAWEIIEDEPTPVNQLYAGYALVLILVPALSEFLRFAVISGHIHAGISGFIHQFLVNTIVVFGLAGIMELLAPSLYSEKNYRKSFQLVIYSLTPFWLSGITIIFLGRRLIIIFLAWIYCAYIMKKGLPLLKKTPANYATGYLALTVIVMIFGTFLVSSILDFIF